MPKGKRFSPSADNDGIWFQHIGQEGCRCPETKTETRTMMRAPFNAATACYPPHPPVSYQVKDTVNFKRANLFSNFDNRDNVPQDGEWLGNGGPCDRLRGRRLANSLRNQHRSEVDFLTHHGRTLVDFNYNTIHSDNYRGAAAVETTAPCRRFPKVYTAPVCGLPQLSAPFGREEDKALRAAEWSYPLGVLACTQNRVTHCADRWKYSYRGLARCYPPYAQTFCPETVEVACQPVLCQRGLAC